MKRNHRSLTSIHGLKVSLSAFVMLGFLSVRGEAAEPDLLPHKNVHVTVTSSQLEPLSLNEKTEPKDKNAVFYSDKDSRVEINENGEPNLNTRF